MNQWRASTGRQSRRLIHLLCACWLCLLLLQLRCLNEQQAGSVVRVFKPWEQRLQPTAEPLRSNDDDPELLVHVP